MFSQISFNKRITSGRALPIQINFNLERTETSRGTRILSKTTLLYNIFSERDKELNLGKLYAIKMFENFSHSNNSFSTPEIIE